MRSSVRVPEDARQAAYAAYRALWRAAVRHWLDGGRPDRFYAPVRP